MVFGASANRANPFSIQHRLDESNGFLAATRCCYIIRGGFFFFSVLADANQLRSLRWITIHNISFSLFLFFFGKGEKTKSSRAKSATIRRSLAFRRSPFPFLIHIFLFQIYSFGPFIFTRAIGIPTSGL